MARINTIGHSTIKYLSILINLHYTSADMIVKEVVALKNHEICGSKRAGEMFLVFFVHRRRRATSVNIREKKEDKTYLNIICKCIR